MKIKKFIKYALADMVIFVSVLLAWMVLSVIGYYVHKSVVAELIVVFIVVSYVTYLLRYRQ